jgi:hypothetical protein
VQQAQIAEALNGMIVAKLEQPRPKATDEIAQ